VKKPRKKRVGGGLGGVALAFGVAFTALLDPAKGAAVEEIDRNRERGDHESGQGGEKIER
jgi:hypothetical protein